MRNLNLSYAKASLDDRLVSRLATCNLSLTSLPNSLDRCNDFLVLGVRRRLLEWILLRALALVDLEFQNPFVRSISASV